jgi:hypothetical protein
VARQFFTATHKNLNDIVDLSKNCGGIDKQEPGQIIKKATTKLSEEYLS